MSTSPTHPHPASDDEDDDWSSNFRTGLVELQADSEDEGGAEEDRPVAAEVSGQVAHASDLASIDASLVEETVSFKESPFTIAARNASTRRSRLANAVNTAAATTSSSNNAHTSSSTPSYPATQPLKAATATAPVPIPTSGPAASTSAAATQHSRFFPINSHLKPQARAVTRTASSAPSKRRAGSPDRGLSPISEAGTISTPSSSPGRSKPRPPMKRQKTQLDLTSKKATQAADQQRPSAPAPAPTSVAATTTTTAQKPPLLPARVAFERPKRGRQSKLRLDGLPEPAAAASETAEERIHEASASAEQRIYEPAPHQLPSDSAVHAGTSSALPSSPKSGPVLPAREEDTPATSLPASTTEHVERKSTPVATSVMEEQVESSPQGMPRQGFISAAQLLDEQGGYMHSAPQSPSNPDPLPAVASASRLGSPIHPSGPVRFVFNSPGVHRTAEEQAADEEALAFESFAFDPPRSLPTPEASSSSVPLPLSRSAYMQSNAEIHASPGPQREMYALDHRDWEDAVANDRPITINQAVANAASPSRSAVQYSMPISPPPSLPRAPQRYSSPPREASPPSFGARSSQHAPSPSQWSTLWASSLGQHSSTAKVKSKVREGESVARSLIAQQGSFGGGGRRAAAQAPKVTKQGRALAARKFRLPLIPSGGNGGGGLTRSGNSNAYAESSQSRRLQDVHRDSPRSSRIEGPLRRRSSSNKQTTQRTIGAKRITLFQPTPLALKEREARERRAREMGHSEQDAFWLT